MTTSHVIKPLTPETYPAWLALAQKHNGVWGGCYCSYFHGDTDLTVKREHDGPTFKRRLVEEGVAHAALVFDGDAAIAWCQYGSPAELPNIYHRKQYDAGETAPAPWRITAARISRAVDCSCEGSPTSPTNDSSIEYTCCQVPNRPSSSITRADMSP